MKLERWTEPVAPLTSEQELAAAQWRALRAEPELDGLALARLQNRVVQASRPARRRAGVWRWSPALLAVAILGIGGIAAATIGVVVQRTRASRPAAPTSVREEPRPSKPRRPAIVRAPEPLPAAAEVLAPVPPPAPVQVAHPQRVAARARAVAALAPVPSAPAVPPAPAAVAPPAAVVEAPAAPPSDGAQVRLFSSAMRAWRARDAAGALAGIGEYQRRFPGGHFAQEALVVKVDALQALGRSTDALQFLRSLSLDELPRSTELHLIRAELSLKSGHCEGAMADLDRVLERERRDPLGARALYARASCRAKLGDDIGAESDLRLYLLRHPDGDHLDRVKRALER